jgi:hypothetical protein
MPPTGGCSWVRQACQRQLIGVEFDGAMTRREDIEPRISKTSERVGARAAGASGGSFSASGSVRASPGRRGSPTPSGLTRAATAPARPASPPQLHPQLPPQLPYNCTGAAPAPPPQTPPHRPGTALPRPKWGWGNQLGAPPLPRHHPPSTLARAHPGPRHHDGINLDAASERPPSARQKHEATSRPHWLPRRTTLQCADTHAGTSPVTSWNPTRRGLDHESDVRDVRERLAIHGLPGLLPVRWCSLD